MARDSPVAYAAIAARGPPEAEPESQTGTPAYCTQGRCCANLLSLGNIDIGSNGTCHGIPMRARGRITLQSDNVATRGIWGEALAGSSCGLRTRSAAARPA
ncbi:hypothetical protein GE300_15985 [Rhodobacteraceae bacterium 2CG4]|uniref:Uncharacterized protein n=1 Tax=Halovulum marinum TaxID=2662447 RepID=A0A6L5Z4R1_9RHOB|nr:hypothetical protein [Halovulum marinum]MSU91090.1 hypothetical protein [Halovulum marinum]